ncbi:hydroxysqualene dehydroxylase [Natrarchaeobius oligotrophus]|uniref:FAD-dependent oxidoreductase n=1 Tax=Natrarchaeobius chitinivorans TaxID=1679083 RepID=A0A3N6MGV7_NATCH|nr:FAD-dependent oxidoreductase [Natrarchaeobius chitinivorans]RQH03239.1 FAD-dependent oxidoreductase [Natrarchaeobius chitinivorans]
MVEVAVLGGGVGGLSAAHELAERGVSVTVYESGDRMGGKARSFPGPCSSCATPLPAEHGFRFFPGFYQHVTDTMSRIPFDDGSVLDNLVETTEVLQASAERQWTMSTNVPTTIGGFRTATSNLFGGPEVSGDEKAYFLNRIGQLLTCSEERLAGELDEVSWWEFIDADRMSHKYRQNLAYGLSQSFVALQPRRASTRTMGRIYLQLLQGMFDESKESDLVLNGPTSDVWIDPWTTYLESLGVDFRPNTPVTAIESDGEVVTGVRVDDGGTERTITAEYYVVGLPLGVLESLLTPELEAAAPSVAGVSHLDEAWMNGIQFYLEEDVDLVHGHGIYYDSPWAITTISQRQFWDGYDFDDHEGVEGILSVCVSNWNDPGIVYDKPARECTRDEIKTEVLAQLERHLAADRGVGFSADLVRDWCLDPAITFGEDGTVDGNREPLFINSVGSLKHRPEPATAAENLTVATDYARTNSELACMESANEAARRAVNAILARSDWSAEPCRLWQLTLPRSIEGLQRVDELIYRGGFPHPGAVSPTVWSGYSALRSLF